MIYATLSCTGVLRTAEITSGNATEITWHRPRLQKGVGTGSGTRAMEEARNIYRCRVCCEVVPRVTGIRFPGAAGPCHGTGPSFTWRTSLDLIHAPFRAHHRPIRTIALRSRPSVKHPRDHADRWHNAATAAFGVPVCPRSSRYREPRSFPPISRYRKIVPSIISRFLSRFLLKFNRW